MHLSIGPFHNKKSITITTLILVVCKRGNIEISIIMNLLRVIKLKPNINIDIINDKKQYIQIVITSLSFFSSFTLHEPASRSCCTCLISPVFTASKKSSLMLLLFRGSSCCGGKIKRLYFLFASLAKLV